MVAVCMLIHGGPLYAEAGRAAVLSVLRHTPFDLFIALGAGTDFVAPASPRVHVCAVGPPPAAAGRAAPFLLKFQALRRCLELGRHDTVLLLDADAIMVRHTSVEDVREALGPHGLAMAEQTTITGSGMDRADFLDHYRRHTLALLGPAHPAPALEAFHYFNSGVVLGRRETWEDFLDWAEEQIPSVQGPHAVGEHMIADQDYFQFWVHALRPGSCALLPWAWNHCEHWDPGFPAPGARILHYSNFCEGPTGETVASMWETEAALDANPDAITVVVVTHNSADVVDNCLSTLEGHGRPRVVVVDNASTDNTVQRALRHEARVVSLPENTGFARAANTGVARARTPNICLLNPDAVVEGPFFEEAARLVREDPATCVVPRFHDGNGIAQDGRQPGYSPGKLLADILETNYHHALLPRLLKARRGYHDDRWYWPLGACVFLRKALFEKVGGFDERYFMYMEDVDFGLRLFAGGGSVRQASAAVRHQGCTGAAVSAGRRLALLNEARLKFAERNFGRPYAMLLKGLVAARRKQGL